MLLCQLCLLSCPSRLLANSKITRSAPKHQGRYRSLQTLQLSFETFFFQDTLFPISFSAQIKMSMYIRCVLYTRQIMLICLLNPDKQLVCIILYFTFEQSLMYACDTQTRVHTHTHTHQRACLYVRTHLFE